jgi:hypothetical protein
MHLAPMRRRATLALFLALLVAATTRPTEARALRASAKGIVITPHDLEIVACAFNVSGPPEIPNYDIKCWKDKKTLKSWFVTLHDQAKKNNGTILIPDQADIKKGERGTCDVKPIGVANIETAHFEFSVIEKNETMFACTLLRSQPDA